MGYELVLVSFCPRLKMSELWKLTRAKMMPSNGMITRRAHICYFISFDVFAEVVEADSRLIYFKLVIFDLQVLRSPLVS